MSTSLPMKCLVATGLSLPPPPSQDAYIHAEVHGAATVILRSPSDDPVAGRAMLPLLTHSLEQVGGGWGGRRRRGAMLPLLTHSLEQVGGEGG